MRILQLHTRYRQAGGEDGVADGEADLLRSAGHEVVALRRQNARSSLDAARQLASYAWNPASDRHLTQVVGRIQPDVIHIHNTWFAMSPGVLPSLRRQEIPIVATVHNYRLSCLNAELLRDGKPCERCVGRTPWQGVRFRCYHGSFGQSAMAAVGTQAHRVRRSWQDGVDRFIALTEFSRGRLVAGGLPAERVVVKSNFVADPGPREDPPSASRQVLFAGRVSVEKGLKPTLEAWARKPPAGLELVVAGDGPLREDLERMQVPGVRFLGRLPRSRVDRLLLESRAAIVPSVWFESQPLTVLEAFAAGTPVLAAAIGGLSETVAPLGANWQVRTGDVDAWSSALSRLTDDDLVNRGGEAARRAFERDHTAAHARQMLEHVYAEAAAETVNGVAS